MHSGRDLTPIFFDFDELYLTFHLKLHRYCAICASLRFSVVIYKPDPYQSCGHGGIPAVVLKKCVPVLFKLYNKFFLVSCFPAWEKSFFVVPVFKNSGEPFDP